MGKKVRTTDAFVMYLRYPDNKEHWHPFGAVAVRKMADNKHALLSFSLCNPADPFVKNIGWNKTVGLLDSFDRSMKVELKDLTKKKLTTIFKVYFDTKQSPIDAYNEKKFRESVKSYLIKG